jgi:hypothetical protein
MVPGSESLEKPFAAPELLETIRGVLRVGLE